MDSTTTPFLSTNDTDNNNNNSTGMAKSSVVVIGSGVFGVGAAKELYSRGHRGTLIDPTLQEGANPLASSTDVSKIVRSDYGNDDLYYELHEEGLKIWREWNRKWGEDLFHETGLLITSKKKAPAGMTL